MNLLFKFSLKTVKPRSLFKLKVQQNMFMLILKEKNVTGKAVGSERIMNVRAVGSQTS